MLGLRFDDGLMNPPEEEEEAREEDGNRAAEAEEMIGIRPSEEEEDA